MQCATGDLDLRRCVVIKSAAGSLPTLSGDQTADDGSGRNHLIFLTTMLHGHYRWEARDG